MVRGRRGSTASGTSVRRSYPTSPKQHGSSRLFPSGPSCLGSFIIWFVVNGEIYHIVSGGGVPRTSSCSSAALPAKPRHGLSAGLWWGRGRAVPWGCSRPCLPSSTTTVFISRHVEHSCLFLISVGSLRFLSACAERERQRGEEMVGNLGQQRSG